jgi:hypothetical protein
MDTPSKHIEHSESILAISDEHDNLNNNLYILFTTGKLFELNEEIIVPDGLNDEISTVAKKRNRKDSISREPSKRMKKPVEREDYITSLTPALKAYVSPSMYSQFSEKLQTDQDLIDKLNMLEDEEFVPTDNYGKLVETWYADTCLCPVCLRPSLRRYVNNNFPTIDVICINEKHLFTHGVKFFQIKSMNVNSTYVGGLTYPKYFDIDNCYIHVGSRKFGEIVHNIGTISSDFEKKILIGYICICFAKVPLQNKLRVICNKSFIVLPKTTFLRRQLFTESEEDDDLSIFECVDANYYGYVNDSNPIISFSMCANNVYRFHNKPTYIDTNYDMIRTWNIIDNPCNTL